MFEQFRAKGNCVSKTLKSFAIIFKELVMTDLVDQMESTMWSGRMYNVMYEDEDVGFGEMWFLK